MKKRFRGVFPLAVCLVTLLLCSVNQVQAIDLQTNSPTYTVGTFPQASYEVASMEVLVPAMYVMAIPPNVVKQPIKHMPIHWADVLIRGKSNTYIKQNRNRSVNQFDVRPQKK